MSTRKRMGLGSWNWQQVIEPMIKACFRLSKSATIRTLSPIVKRMLVSYGCIRLQSHLGSNQFERFFQADALHRHRQRQLVHF